MSARKFNTGITTSATAPLGRLTAATYDFIALADLPATGTPSGTNFLRGDGTWSGPAAGDLTGSALASGVTASSLTSVGTITSGVWHGTAIGAAYLPAIDALTAPAGDLSLNSHKITNLANGSATTDAATYGQLLALVNGAAWKAPVLVVATTNLALSGEQTIDGVLTSASRVAVAGQSTASQNGIYTTGAGSWARVADLAAGAGAAGVSFFVEKGTTYADTQWICTSDPGSDVVGTNGLAFSQFGAGTSYSADESSLHLSGSTFSIKSTWVGQSAITTVGTLTSGATGAGFTVALGTSTVTGVLGAGNGGTGNGFFAVSGPTTSTRTFTFPNASATVLTSNAAVTVAQGGTGLTSLTANNLIVGAGTSNVTFIAPGTSGNVLTSNGTTWASTAPAATALPLIILQDQKASGTDGGTFTSGAWRTRDLNTEVVDTGNNCTLAANRFILLPGTYRIRARLPSIGCGYTAARLYDTTSGVEVLAGTVGYSVNTGNGVQRDDIIEGRFTIGSSKALELQQWCTVTRTGDGFGAGSVITVTAAIYTSAVIEREA